MANASFRGSRNITRELKNTINQKVTNVAQKSRNVASSIKENAQSVSGKINNAVKSVTDKIPSPVVNQYLNLSSATKQFTESNTAISKFVFIVVILMLTIFFFNLGCIAIQKMVGSKKDPILLDGMVPANKTTKISVNPNNKASVPIYRSVNEDQGIEFTWNIWFFIEGLNTTSPTYSRIFSKGSDNAGLKLKLPASCTDNSCKNIFNSSPGLFITQNKQNDSVFPNAVGPTKLNNRANLILLLNTYKTSNNNSEFAESITIENVPIQKWVCATIRVQQTTVDIYINGVMTQRKILNNIPRQNYYDVVVGDANDGFSGSISSLRYFNKALGYDEIQGLYGKGPNLNSLNNAGLSYNMDDYISMNWYYK
jgi:hypothetical protein